jgi:hypothetical protein
MMNAEIHAAPRNRIVIEGDPVTIVLEREATAPRGVWRWDLGGWGLGCGEVMIERRELAAFGAALTSFLAGSRAAAELVSRCGRLRLGVCREGAACTVYFRASVVSEYRAGATRASDAALERAASLLLGLPDAPSADTAR